uniref:hypothetical protein n=1 Tax=Paractinoplanes polyasparticus TaxID=2856853 RepID=UPI001C85DD2C|nr:hypothetical protein [Actinoplanes polyasparticus]
MSRTRTGIDAILLAGVAFTTFACGTDETPDASGATAVPSITAPAEAVTSSATSSTPKPTGATGSPGAPDGDQGSSGGYGPILSGKRQVVIRPAQEAEGILAVDAQGRLNLTDGEAEHTLFVFVPVRDGLHQIRTAKAGAGGEPSCMGIRSNGSNPLTVVAAACDTRRAGQLFRVRKAPEAEADGYGISNQGAYLQISADRGLIAEELSDAPLRTVYTFVDNGAAPAQPGS